MTATRRGPLGKSDVRRAIATLAATGPGLVPLSPHDSSDWTIAEFSRAFCRRYRELLVGREIVVD